VIAAIAIATKKVEPLLRLGSLGGFHAIARIAEKLKMTERNWIQQDLVRAISQIQHV